MLFSPLTWAIFAFTLLIILPGALASPSPKRTKRQSSTRVTVETYPAIVGDEDEILEISVPKSLKMSAPETPPKPRRYVQPRVKPSKAKKQTVASSSKKLGNQKRDAQKLSDQSLGEEAPVNPPLQKHDPIAKQTPIAQTKTEKRGKKYENVPAEKRDQILKRIQLCETLFMESGRAYDYREMTTAELEGELVAVRQSKAQVVDSYASQEMGSLEADPLFEKDPILNPDLAPEVE